LGSVSRVGSAGKTAKNETGVGGVSARALLKGQGMWDWVCVKMGAARGGGDRGATKSENKWGKGWNRQCKVAEGMRSSQGQERFRDEKQAREKPWGGKRQGGP
jgi:hypothetical protein